MTGLLNDSNNGLGIGLQDILVYDSSQVTILTYTLSNDTGHYEITLTHASYWLKSTPEGYDTLSLNLRINISDQDLGKVQIKAKPQHR